MGKKKVNIQPIVEQVDQLFGYAESWCSYDLIKDGHTKPYRRESCFRTIPADIRDGWKEIKVLPPSDIRGEDIETAEWWSEFAQEHNLLPKGSVDETFAVTLPLDIKLGALYFYLCMARGLCEHIRIAEGVKLVMSHNKQGCKFTAETAVLAASFANRSSNHWVLNGVAWSTPWAKTAACYLAIARIMQGSTLFGDKFCFSNLGACRSFFSPDEISTIDRYSNPSPLTFTTLSILETGDIAKVLERHLFGRLIKDKA